MCYNIYIYIKCINKCTCTYLYFISKKESLALKATLDAINFKRRDKNVVDRRFQSEGYRRTAKQKRSREIISLN